MMRRTLGLAVALVVGLTWTVLAGAMYRNDSGAVARAVRIEFSEPAEITSMWPSFPQRDPQGPSTVILLSGAEIAAGGWLSFTWRPDTARVVKIEWLVQAPTTFSVEESEPLPDLVTEFHVSLPSEDGSRTLSGTITRFMSNERIPFSVRYEVACSEPSLTYSWSCQGESPNVVLPPTYLAEFGPCASMIGPERSPPTLVMASEDGSEATVICPSNFFTYDVTLVIRDPAGGTYTWSDTGIDFLLHTATPITLDATRWFAAQDIAGVVWKVENGDPSDAVTFPIANHDQAIATLASQWPNVLQVTAEIELRDGRRQERTTEALIYFGDGTPFPIRGTAVPLAVPRVPADFDIALDEMFPVLRRLGLNAVVASINWYFGPPDHRGVYTLTPVGRADPNYPLTTSGSPTPEDSVVRRFFRRVKEEGLAIVAEVNQFALDNVSDEEKYGRAVSSVKFFYGDGQGYANQLEYYLDMFTSEGVDVVFLGAETPSIAYGDAISRAFFSKMLGLYRAAGFSGGLSYAIGVHFHDRSMSFPIPGEFYFPSLAGIPFDEMDYIGFTWYSRLASRPGSTTEEMFNEAVRQIETYLQPLYRAWNKQLFVRDFYGFPFDGMSMDPLKTTGAFSFEEQRRWTTAWLRAFSQANDDRENPLIAGLAAQKYPIEVNLKCLCWSDDLFRRVDLNYGVDRPDLQRLVMVYFRDVPLRK